jgi:diacylglycerol kinase family enzyme
MRGYLVVNPNATTTTPRTRDVLVHALAAEHDITVVETNHRGHAEEIGRQALEERVDVVVALGGDGTVNEVVNGVLTHGPSPDVPIVTAVPAGSANVFARAIGFPADAVEATGMVLEGLRDKRVRTIGLGTMHAQTVDGTAFDRWFLFNAGLGVDAEVIHAMEAQREQGNTASMGRYVQTALAEILLHTDRRNPALTIERPGTPPVDHVFVAIIQNTAPWTFLGSLPVNASPRASFDTGLDLWAPRTLSLLPTLRYARRMVTGSKAGSTRRGLLVVHDANEFTVSSNRPVALQIDGEGLGEVTRVTATSVPRALRVIV